MTYESRSRALREKAGPKWHWEKCYELTSFVHGDDVVEDGFETRKHWALVYDGETERVADHRLVLHDSYSKDLVAESPAAAHIVFTHNTAEAVERLVEAARALTSEVVLGIPDHDRGDDPAKVDHSDPAAWWDGIRAKVDSYIEAERALDSISEEGK